MIVGFELLKAGDCGILESEVCIFAAKFDDAVDQSLRAVLALGFAHDLDQVEVRADVVACEVFWHGDDFSSLFRGLERFHSSIAIPLPGTAKRCYSSGIGNTFALLNLSVRLSQ